MGVYKCFKWMSYEVLMRYCNVLSADIGVDIINPASSGLYVWVSTKSWDKSVTVQSPGVDWYCFLVLNPTSSFYQWISSVFSFFEDCCFNLYIYILLFLLAFVGASFFFLKYAKQTVGASHIVIYYCKLTQYTRAWDCLPSSFRWSW